MSQSCRKRSRTSAVDNNDEDSVDSDCLSSASESMLSEGYYCTLPGNSQNQLFDHAPPNDSTDVNKTQQSSGYCSFPSLIPQVDPTEAADQPLVPNNSDHTHSPLDADSSSSSSVIFVDETSLDMHCPDSPAPESWTTREFSASLLSKTFGPQASFRDPQQQVIEYLVNERCRILVIEPAGWGKTFVYVAAAMAIRQFAHRVTLVATPLLALMRNQAELARSYGAEVESLSSQANNDDRIRIRRRIIQRDVDVVLTTPEQLSGAFFTDDDDDDPLLECVGLLVVDEAQCITQWGSDFRPDFRRLTAVVERLPRQAAIMATTATATAAIAEDIRNVLRIEEKWCIRGELQLPSVQLQVVKVRLKGGGGLAWLVQNIPGLAGTGIIYCLKIVTAETIARLLRANGVDARAYYSSVLPPRDVEGFEEYLAGDSNAYRQHLEQQFSENKLKVLVATSALGMGFDKPDVGFVVLYQSPISLATFYQQLGRAGRRMDNAVGIVVHDGRACHLQRFFIGDTLYKRDELVSIIETLGYNRDNGGEGMTVGDLERKCNFPTKSIETALKFLTTLRHPPVDCVANSEDQVAWRKIREPNYEFYENIRLRAIEVKQADWKLVMKFCNLKGKRQCLMRQLCKDLGGRSTPKYRCGKCSVCLREPIIRTDIDSAILDSVIQRMKSSSDLPLVLKQTVPAGAFTEYDFSDELLGRVEEGRIMCNWREPGWGEIIADECYYSEHPFLGEHIVEAAAELITERWQPNPRLRWVTCIPSATAATFMVPDFAERLSTRLGLRFRPAVKVSKRMQPKKDQKNVFFRCRNLDGGYVINRKKMLKGPVLLIDYLVRSSWTLTVAAALLNQAGSGPVFPLALAKIGGHDID